MPNVPMLVILSGPPGSGKTTLAHQLAKAIGCPAVCRDEIKEGMARSVPGYVPSPGDELDDRTLTAFVGTLRVLLEHRVTVVAEAAFQDHVWKPILAAFVDIAELRVVQCQTDFGTAKQRVAEHAATRQAHADTALLSELEASAAYFENFQRLTSDLPTIDVVTTRGYAPTIDAVVMFVTPERQTRS